LHQQGKPLIDNLPAGTYARKIFNHLLINLSYNSARLEGNSYSFADTEKLLLEGKTATDKLDMETVMLLFSSQSRDAGTSQLDSHAGAWELGG